VSGELVRIVDAELEPIEPPVPVDLDALVGLVIDAEIVEDVEPAAPPAEPDVIDAEVVERPPWRSPPWRSPLDPAPWESGYPTLLRGGVVSDPAAVEVIGKSIDYALRPWWWRLFHRAPAGYTAHLADGWRL